MDLDPDHSSARGDQETLRRVLLTALEQAGLPGPPRELPLPLHPAAAEVARRLNTADATTGPAEWPVELPGSWQPAERATFAAGVRLLAAVWPHMLDELRATVSQVTLLDTLPTDAAALGVAALDRRSLTPTPAGLPGSVRLAEALVYEGTRCRGAAEAAARGTAAAEPSHRTVALARCVLLYERLLSAGPAAEPAMEERYGRLRAELGATAGGGDLLG
ncbi:hypothetical protein ACH427_22935 [Streptomyces sp. NPDC020379]|uniref:hypothetical protein n=1 Tax=Streptomyces sp. NPDC020379 TaxID=3365071 RepID=UPI00378FCD40